MQKQKRNNKKAQQILEDAAKALVEAVASGEITEQDADNIRKLWVMKYNQCHTQSLAGQRHRF